MVTEVKKLAATRSGFVLLLENSSQSFLSVRKYDLIIMGETIKNKSLVSTFSENNTQIIYSFICCFKNVNDFLEETCYNCIFID